MQVMIRKHAFKRKKRRYNWLNSPHLTGERTNECGPRFIFPPFFAVYGLTSFSCDGVDLIAQTWQQTGKGQMNEVCDVINKMTLVS